MTIPQGFKQVKTNQFCWGRRGDLMFVNGEWKWIGMCSFRVGSRQTLITPNNRIKTFRRGDVVLIVESDGSTYPYFQVITAISPDNHLDKDRVDIVPLGSVESVATLRKNGIGMPTKYLKKFGWNLVDLPYLLPTMKMMGRV